MHKNIETVAGCLTRLTCEVITADGATPPELTAYVLIEQQSYPARQEPDGVLLFPAVDYGQHLYEVRADGKPVLFGHLLVRPSAFPQDSGVVDYALVIDASQVDGAKITLTLTPGPKGESGQLQPYHSGALPATLEAGHAYDLGTLATATDLSALASALPARADRVQTAELWFSLGDTAPAITWPQDAAWPEEPSALAPAALTTARAYRFALRREPGGKLIICRAYEYSLA